MKMECGHYCHLRCFEKHWRDLDLPCPTCAQPLGKAVPSPCGTWHVGVQTEHGMLECYQVSSESKISRDTRYLPDWRRTASGRLERRSFCKLKNSIFIS